jgi:hypothetical protein
LDFRRLRVYCDRVHVRERPSMDKWTAGLLVAWNLPAAIPALGRWIKVNVSDKWHRPIAIRTLYIGFGRS